MISEPTIKFSAAVKPFTFNNTSFGSAVAVVAEACDFFFILFHFRLHIRDFSLKVRPVQLCRCLRRVAAANHVLELHDPVSHTRTNLSDFYTVGGIWCE